ncbi:hypothetical protein N0V87_008736 [Didymella glomerata]|uniref:Helicase C-terminal domain-containing protein n=1 Tax=Didymella glomerata TaxID=749621 RepID=A0A9W8WTI8_9PLEO|nr:hypothetical protein N0V87_008736 [Didymella glomerata]
MYYKDRNGRPASKEFGTSYTTSQLLEFSVIITTYGMIRKQKSSMDRFLAHWERWIGRSQKVQKPDYEDFPFFMISWWQIVLDEAHIVSNPFTAVSQAVCQLEGEYRIAITGTPLQNKIIEVQGLMAFLHIEPWQDFNAFMQVFGPTKLKITGDSKANEQMDLLAIFICSLRAIMLRLKVGDTFNGQQVANFKHVQPTWIREDLTSEQQNFQNLVKFVWDPMSRAEHLLAKKDGLDVGVLGRDDILPAIIEARLACLHPACVWAKYNDPDELSVDEILEDLPEDFKDVFKLALSQPSGDTSSHSNDSNKLQASDDRRKTFRAWASLGTNWSSPRINKTCEIICGQIPRGRKIIVLCEWLCGLDILHAALESYGHEVLRYDGSSTSKERNGALNKFRLDSSCYVLLMTIRAGGLGLNLQIAKVVVHLNCSWNPAVTDQGTARVVRDGNDDDLEVFRFVANDSMESYVLRTADSKRSMASQVLDPDEDIVTRISDAAGWDPYIYEAKVS